MKNKNTKANSEFLPLISFYLYIQIFKYTNKIIKGFLL